MKMQEPLMSPVFTGSRGARFVHLVNQKVLNVSPQLSKLNKQRRFSVSGGEMVWQRQVDNVHDVKKDYLEFSSEKKFNPNASPSSSILSKRKAEFAAPDSTPLSSSAKRKRVGFRDPVSSTKEYLISVEEERAKSAVLSARCLIYCNEDGEEKEEDDGEVKIPHEEEIDSKMEVIEDIEMSIKEERRTQAINVSPMSDHDYENSQYTDVTTSDCTESIEAPKETFGADKLVFNNKNELMDYITKNLSADELFEKLTQAEEESLKRKQLVTKVVKTVGFNGLLNEYFSTEVSDGSKLSTEQNSVITTIITEVSKLMQNNLSVKHKVLNVLSEKHSAELLEHTIQENSPAAICNMLTLPKVVNYLLHKVNMSEEEEHRDVVNTLTRTMIRRLVNDIAADHNIVSQRSETEELLELLFKNKSQVEVFDTAYDFLRKIMQQNH